MKIYQISTWVAENQLLIGALWYQAIGLLALTRMKWDTIQVEILGFFYLFIIYLYYKCHFRVVTGIWLVVIPMPTPGIIPSPLDRWHTWIVVT